MEPSVLIESSLDENDIVLYQLFAASQSDRIKKKRSRSKLVYPIIFLSIAVVPFIFRDYTAVSILAISSVLWYFMYPTWEKKRYEKHYREFVQENWKNKLNKKMKVELNRDNLMLEEEGGESKISTKEISSITEIKEAFVVMFSPAQGILFPKSKVSDPQLLKECLKRIAADNKLPYNEEMEWRWR